jgi:hypothetical protein
VLRPVSALVVIYGSLVHKIHGSVKINEMLLIISKLNSKVFSYTLHSQTDSLEVLVYLALPIFYLRLTVT